MDANKGDWIAVWRFPRRGIQLCNNINDFWLFKYSPVIAWSQLSIWLEAVMFSFIFKSAIDALK